MTESALPARLKLNSKRQRPRGGVWGGDRCGEPREGHGDDGKRASSAIGVDYQAARPLGEGLGAGPLGRLGRVTRMTESALPARLELTIQASAPLERGPGRTITAEIKCFFLGIQPPPL